MLQKVLIANRGAIAVRILRTLKSMGVKSVAIYAEADADSPHVHLADEAYSLGSGGATETYLNQTKIFEIIESCGADAVHPGYGFLSENAEFSRNLEAQGIQFIGPTDEQMLLFGLKHKARALAQENNVPLLSGTDLLVDVDDALVQAERIGYPVMLKSTAGGGGIGMQICYDAEQLGHAWQSVLRLSQNNFSNSGIFLEKYIEFARHIEVQVFGDGLGSALILGDRDCSAQRRHQKVIEEAPAPNIPEPVRAQLHQVAKQLVESVQYRNAGTVEFIYDQLQDAFYFLEMNTRLQVEHGVTEQIYDVDLVCWQVQLAAGNLPDLSQLSEQLKSQGHAIQARIYAENPSKDFQPCAGLLNYVEFPAQDGKRVRIDHWIESGSKVSAFFDPMLAKVICYGDTRDAAIAKLQKVLDGTIIEGIETNKDYVRAVLQTEPLKNGAMYTRYLSTMPYEAHACDVLIAGTLTTIQDYPGRLGYWDVGVPPSGPFDDYAFRLGNCLLQNPEDAAGLEITMNGPSLRFHTATQVAVTGAAISIRLDGDPVDPYSVIDIAANQTLQIGKIQADGARAYLLIRGGFQCQRYLGSRATFTLGQFGGLTGKALCTGDTLHYLPLNQFPVLSPRHIPLASRPKIPQQWSIRVIYGPHGAPDFFTADDIELFFKTAWKVHYNSSRTGVRLIGPKPQWARTDGGEAGMHPSNIHDNAYAVGSIDFTGDMPVILGPDGPSLGGFVCPVTVIMADLWMLGQLRAGDAVQFVPVAYEDAIKLLQWQSKAIGELGNIEPPVVPSYLPESPIILRIPAEQYGVEVVYRPAGENNVLIEYGPQKLDIELRFRAHAMMLKLQEKMTLEQDLQVAIKDLTPGIRSLQVHFDPLLLDRSDLIELLQAIESQLLNLDEIKVPSRIVHLPLSWNDDACQMAVEKYMQSVRKDAPWCPDNIEFIRRINGLSSVAEVKRIVFDASYVVMGLGDVYLGAPVATPLDPRHRLVTTKYNPARTWTAENSVGIGGSYLCVYGMEGPGGYQFVGRTLQMWNRYKATTEFSRPWLLRFFDQIRFYEVDAQSLTHIRSQFPQGRYALKIEQTEFCLKDYQQFLADEKVAIDEFVTARNHAFQDELARWNASGQIHFQTDENSDPQVQVEEALPDGCSSVESPVAGNIWKITVDEGAQVAAGEVVCILESMKMEIDIVAPVAGTVKKIFRSQGQAAQVGQTLLIIEEDLQ